MFKELSSKDDQLQTGIQKRHTFIRQLDLLTKALIVLIVVVAIWCYMSQGFYEFITKDFIPPVYLVGGVGMVVTFAHYFQEHERNKI